MVIIWLHALIYAVTGVTSGFIAGVLGIGGGMIVVPALLYIFQHTHDVPPGYEMHFAAGSSLAIMIFTAQSAVRAHLRKKGIVWPIYRRLQAGIIVGAILGALLADRLPTQWLRIILGVFLLVIAAEMLFNPNLPRRKDFPPNWINRLVSTLIGFKSGLLGIGGGALIIPYLSYCGVERRQTVGVSSMCTLVVGVIGTVAFMITGTLDGVITPFATGYVYWPAVVWIAIPSMICAPMGAHLTYQLANKHLKQIFIVVLVIAAVSLMF